MHLLNVSFKANLHIKFILTFIYVNRISHHSKTTVIKKQQL